MPTLSKILEGINIINSYYTQDGYNMEAEHDQIFMAATDHPIIPRDLRKLWDIGWFQKYQPEGEYSQEEHWALYI